MRSTKLPIASTRVITWGEVSASERRRVVSETLRIYRRRFDEEDLGRYERLHFPMPSTRVALFFGRGHELAGFSHATVLKLELEDRAVNVFSAGVFFDSQYRGGRAAARFGFREALKLKLMSPRVPVAYMSLCSSPAPYLLQARTVRMYPNRRHETPAEIDRWVQAACELRGIATEPGNHWIARSLVPPREQQPGPRLGVRSGNLDRAFYHAQNPGYAKTGATALVTWIPLDLTNIVRGLWRSSALSRVVRPPTMTPWSRLEPTRGGMSRRED